MFFQFCLFSLFCFFLIPPEMSTLSLFLWHLILMIESGHGHQAPRLFLSSHLSLAHSCATARIPWEEHNQKMQTVEMGWTKAIDPLMCLSLKDALPNHSPGQFLYSPNLVRFGQFLYSPNLVRFGEGRIHKEKYQLGLYLLICVLVLFYLKHDRIDPDAAFRLSI